MARSVRRRDAEEPGQLLHPTGNAEAAPSSSFAPKSPLAPYTVLCAAMGAMLHVEPLVAGSADLGIHPAAVVLGVLSTAALFLSISFLVARRPGAEEHGQLLHPTGNAEATPAGSVPRSPLAPFTVICVAMGAVLHADPLVAAAAKFHLQPAVAPCVVATVAALLGWAILSLNFLIAGRPAEHQPKMVLRPTDPAGSAFLFLAALMSAALFIEPFAAAASNLGLPSAAVVVAVVFSAALFNFCIHIFPSFFLSRPLTTAAAAHWEGAGATAVAIAVMGTGIAACLVAVGGSAYVYSPARS